MSRFSTFICTDSGRLACGPSRDSMCAMLNLADLLRGAGSMDAVQLASAADEIEGQAEAWMDLTGWSVEEMERARTEFTLSVMALQHEMEEHDERDD